MRRSLDQLAEASEFIKLLILYKILRHIIVLLKQTFSVEDCGKQNKTAFEGKLKLVLSEFIQVIQGLLNQFNFKTSICFSSIELKMRLLCTMLILYSLNFYNI